MYNFDEEFFIDFDLENLNKLHNLELEVRHKEGFLTKDKFLSRLSLKVQECVSFPG